MSKVNKYYNSYFWAGNNLEGLQQQAPGHKPVEQRKYEDRKCLSTINQAMYRAVGWINPIHGMIFLSDSTFLPGYKLEHSEIPLNPIQHWKNLVLEPPCLPGFWELNRV